MRAKRGGSLRGVILAQDEDEDEDADPHIPSKNPLSGRLYEDDEDEEEDITFFTFGSLLDN
eukprot:15710076-Heterocapsa_arctica.AAC.1